MSNETPSPEDEIPRDAPSPAPVEQAAPAAGVADDVEVYEADVLKRKKRFSWKKLKTDGLLFSVGLHALLLLGGFFLVVNHYTKKPEPDPTFATGSGGGSKEGKSFEQKLKPKTRREIRESSRIVSKNPDSKVSTQIAPKASPLSFATGSLSGDMAKGSGGKGVGIGVGGVPNFVGRFLGSRITAKKVAVYMDASGSMEPYLAKVESEAKRYFPEADVFRYDTINFYVEDGLVVWGANGKSDFKSKVETFKIPQNDPKKLSELGRKILSNNNDRFVKGAVGAWFDRMIREKYDAVIIFSDFDDGVTQRRRSGENIYVDKPGTHLDERKAGDLAWETQINTVLAKAKTGGAPRVYLFSIHTVPQDFWQNCAKVSGGAVTMVKWMKDGGSPPDKGMEEAANAAGGGDAFKPR